MCWVQAISREVVLDTQACEGLTPQRLHANSSDGMSRSEVSRAYLLGALGDATFNRLHRTVRFSQKEREWLETLQQLLKELSHRSWIYREGRQRQLFVLETTAQFLREQNGIEQLEQPASWAAYIRGYFDAEGGLPQDPDAPLYIQLVQKDRVSLMRVRQMLERFGIGCGVLHNPSRRVDPDYWRFFVRRQSHQRFIEIVGSWHPRKARLLTQRMKI